MVKLDLEAAKNEFIRLSQDSNWLLEYDVEACLNGELAEDDPDLESYNKEDVIRTINNLRKGRLLLLDDDEGNIEIKQILSKPVIVGDKEITEFTYKNLNTGDLKRIYKLNKNLVDSSIAAIAMLAGQSTAVVNKLCHLDDKVLSTVFRVFFI